MRYRVFASATVAALLAAGLAAPAQAQDAKELHQLTQNQDFLPLGDLLTIIGKDHPGTVLEAQLEEEDDATSGWVYEIEVLTSPEQITEIEIDAVNGQIIDVDTED